MGECLDSHIPRSLWQPKSKRKYLQFEKEVLQIESAQLNTCIFAVTPIIIIDQQNFKILIP